MVSNVVVPEPLVQGHIEGAHPFTRKDSQKAGVGELVEHDEKDSNQKTQVNSQTESRIVTVGGEMFQLPMKYIAYKMIGRGRFVKYRNFTKI
jgi:hypothetical protein